MDQIELSVGGVKTWLRLDWILDGRINLVEEILRLEITSKRRLLYESSGELDAK